MWEQNQERHKKVTNNLEYNQDKRSQALLKYGSNEGLHVGQEQAYKFFYRVKSQYKNNLYVSESKNYHRSDFSEEEKSVDDQQFTQITVVDRLTHGSHILRV